MELCPRATLMAFDILIKNGLIVDGTGAEGYPGSVAITGNKIEAIGSGVDGQAKLVIDAEDRIVCPGFIDITNHSDTTGTLFTVPTQESMIRQGVTTIIGGNCGTSLAPLVYPDVVASIQKWQTTAPVAVDWLSMGEFLDAIEKLKPGVNFGSLAGFGIIKRGVLHDGVREPSHQEIIKIKFILGEALKEGAFGLSTGLVYAHERATSTAALIDIASVLKKEGGIYKSHVRSESNDLIGAVNEAISIGREADVPVSVSHLKAIGKKAWRGFHPALGLLERAAESGLMVRFDAYPYITTGSFLYLLLPAGVYEGGFAALFSRLRDPRIRLEVIKTLQERTLHHDSIIVSTAWKTKASVGKSIKQIAERIGISPEEAIVQLLLANEGRVRVFGRTVRTEYVREALMHPLSMIASDGSGYAIDHHEPFELPHPRSFGAFPRFIRLATKKWGMASFPMVIKKATSDPAALMGMRRRGTLARGNFADIVIFNPETIKSRGTFENPYQPPIGIEWVIVNGVLAVRNGVFHGSRSGMVLRKHNA